MSAHGSDSAVLCGVADQSFRRLRITVTFVVTGTRSVTQRQSSGALSSLRLILNLFHPAFASRICNTWMALAS